MEYKFSEIEEEIKQRWKENDIYRVKDADSGKPKYYVLDMFPYPSGAGLHVGHPLGYIASDIYARYKRMKGFNVLHPMGYDSFGLPAEQYAIQTGQHPAITTEQNIATFRKQMDQLGFSFDWNREIRTSDPKFYKWTQWIFIQLFHSWYNNVTNKAEAIESLIEEFAKNGNKNVKAATSQQEIFSEGEWKTYSLKQQSDVLLNYRIAYIADSWVNWCAALGTVLANDEVKDGVSERGGYPVERKLMKQWSLRITAYAERLLKGLDELNWSDSIKEAQRNWIGKSEGSSVRFNVEGSDLKVEVFTTRPDTIFGVTFLTLAPEHELINQITPASHKEEVAKYVAYARNRSERERMSDVKKITGQFTGAYTIHPFTGKQVPILIGEYVLASYGTGAVMGVPGHDSRDYGFAKHFNLPIIEVVKGGDISVEAFEGEGQSINSSFLDGLNTTEAKKKAIDEIEKKGIGQRKINFKLRDAIFGRQRYWGEPIPIYYDSEGIPQTVDENDLPLVLPEVDKYLPTEDGEPPLARAANWNYKPHPRPLSEGEGSAGAPVGYQTSNKEHWDVLKKNARHLRKEQTEAEKILWEEVRNNKLGYKIRRQHPIGNYIADFTCLEKRLIIEVDGGIHNEQKEYDEKRESSLESMGFKVIRFSNEEVQADIHKVTEKIKSTLLIQPSYSEQNEKEETSQNAPTTKEKEVNQNATATIAPATPLLRRGAGGEASQSFPLETTTMPGWAGSSWYFLRYEDPHNNNALASPEKIDYWKNIDFYIGGAEHSTGHLIYFRFWTKFLYDLGIVPFEEPAKRLVNQGMITGKSAFALVPPGFEIRSDYSIKIQTNNLPIIFISKNIAEEFIKNDKESVAAVIKSFDSILKKYHPENESYSLNKNYTLGLPEGSEFYTTRFSIDCLKEEGNEVDIILFKKWIRKNFSIDKEVEVITDKDGQFICQREVEKMSKSKYNVVNPDDIVSKYGADCFRLYEMFLGPLELSKPWDTKGIDGVSRFLRKLWRLFYDDSGNWVVTNDKASNEELKPLHKTIKKVEEDMERLSFNTSVSSFMICVNTLTDLKCHKAEVLKDLLLIMAPLAPFTTDFLWRKMEQEGSIVQATFPKYREELLVENVFEYPVAINGKTKAKIELALDLTEEVIEKEVLALESVQKFLEGKTPKKVIVVKGRMVNVVV